MGLGDAQKALDDAEALLDLAPQLAVARIRKGDAHMHLAEWDAASKEFKHVLESAPHHTHALTQLAACYMSMDRAERAEAPSTKPFGNHRITPQRGTSVVSTTCTSTTSITPFRTLKPQFDATDTILMPGCKSLHITTVWVRWRLLRRLGKPF